MPKQSKQAEAIQNEKNEPVDLVSLIEEPAWKIILVELVKKEKMDVWAIDLVKLSQSYLEKIKEMQEFNLRIPANAILACAILLKMKSKAISFSFLKEEREPELSEEEIREMNDMLPELTPLTKIRESTVSLDELMHQIEAVIEKTKQRSVKLRKGEEPYKPKFVMPAFDEKDIAEKIDELFELINERVDEEGLVLFSQLCDDNSAVGMVDAFVPLLFLANKSRVNLWQESFFGEIFISVPEQLPVQSELTESVEGKEN